MSSIATRAWYGIENRTEILVWNMEDARMEWNGRFREWNGRQSSIPIPYLISLMAFTENYIRIEITKIIRKRFAANHLSTNK